VVIRAGIGARNTTMNKLLVLLGVALILATGLAATGVLDGGGGATTPGGATPATVPGALTATVPISGFLFKPASLTVGVGARVTFTNLDSASHTATADNGTAFDTGTLVQRQSKTVTFPTAGTFAYHCAFHPFMQATITVR
jgi:plastocyanin